MATTTLSRARAIGGGHYRPSTRRDLAVARASRATGTRSSDAWDDSSEVFRGRVARALRVGACALCASAVMLVTGDVAEARLEGVNNPQLLPEGETQKVIDVAGYLGKSDVARLTREVENLERDTGLKLRVLAQAYPRTPGLAVKDYWGVDDDTVVFVADPGLGNILNFSVGGNIDLEIPPSFWTRLANKYGTKFYWSERGEEASISAAVNAIDVCAREPSGRAKCSRMADYDDGSTANAVADEPAGAFGGFFGKKF